MRLTINLEEDLYRMAKALALAEDCSISVAVNRLLRHLQESQRDRNAQPGSVQRGDPRTGLPSVPCRKTFSSDDVDAADREEDARHWVVANGTP